MPKKGRSTGRLDTQPWMTAPATRAVIAALAGAGGQPRFVGGCVRDAIAGRAVRDIDIATPLTPQSVMTCLEKASIKAIPTGIEHGTVTAVCAGEHFEITTLRVDVETDGRRARVAFTDDWMADASRRDLTMNAIFLDPGGALYDPFGGVGDLRAGRVRFVGKAEARIEEDVLRLLRFFRFQAWYGAPPPDPEALAACRKLAPKLPRLSAERVWSETRRLLLAPGAGPVFALMDEEGILGHFLPQARNFARLEALAGLETAGIEPDPLRRLAGVINADEAGARSLAERLKLSNAERERLACLARELPGFRPGQGAVARRQLYRLGPERFRDLVLLDRARRLAAAKAPPEAKDFNAGLAEAASWRAEKLPVGGKDAKALGVAPGPPVGEVLASVEQWWIEGDFKATRKQALAKLKALVEGS
ncbi:MAG: CCA tRNA nucleotidyltransferase [Alphaproteobacteria bacterium]